MEKLIQLSNSMILEATSDQHEVSKKAESLRLQKKWAKYGMLEGLKGNIRENLAYILENQARQCKRTMLQEANVVGDIAGFNKIAFPLVRRIFAQLIANNIVSVQPFTQPTGLVFFLDFTFDKTKSGQVAGQSVYGQRNTVLSPKAEGIGAQTGRGGLYGYQALTYSGRDFIISDATTPTYNSVTATSIAVTGTLSGFTFTLSQPAAVDTLAKYAMYPALSGEIRFDTSSASAFRSMLSIKSLSADSLHYNVDRMLTELPTSSTITIYSNLNLVAASYSAVNKLWLLGHADTRLTDASAGVTTQLGDYELTPEMGQLKTNILSLFIGTQTKRLKTVWTPEMAQDLNAYMSLDAEVELTNILSEEIAAEIDREIIADLIGVAAVKGAWSRQIGKYVYVDTNNRIQMSTITSSSTYQAFHGTQDEWNNTFGHVLSAVSNRIHKLNLRKPANWMITSMQVKSIFENMGKNFTASEPSGDELQYSVGTQKAGTMSNKWTVYTDPLFPENLVLMGFKGNSALEAGYIWCPYIPLVVTPTVVDPNNFNPIKGVMTRNGRQTIRPEYYGTVTVTDLGFYTFLQ